jgi:hypothetical protein
MRMTEAFAGAVTVSIPIFALAAGAEARTLRDRLKRPDVRWEAEFSRYRSEHDLDIGETPADVFAFFRGVPGVSKLYVAERLLAIGAAVVWLVIFVLLAVAELLCLLWLGDGAVSADSGLATFSLVSIGLTMITLIISPVAYLLVPVLMPIDLVPKGLKDTVGPKLATTEGRGFVKLVMQELEGAVERATKETSRARTAPSPVTAESGVPPPSAIAEEALLAG